MFADYSLAKRLELAETKSLIENVEIIAKLRPELGACVKPIGDGYAVYIGADTPISRATNLGMSGEVTEADLDTLEEFFNSRGCESRIRLCPLADATLVKELGKRNYHIEMFLNAHFREIKPDEKFADYTSNIEISRLNSADEEIWLKMNLGGFEMTVEWLRDISLARLHNPNIYCLLARINGEPAGISGISVHDKVAGMHNTSVLPEFRSQGIQMALINYRLKLIQSLGCDVVAVDTDPGNNSQRNVERSGFRTAYTKIVLVKN